MSNIPYKLATSESAIVPTSLYALEQSILGWAHERNLIEGSTCRKQLAKTCEEFGELAAGLNKGKKDLIMDGVGDVLVTLIIANGCARGAYLFSSQEDRNDWAVALPNQLLLDSANLVLRMVEELAYIGQDRQSSDWRSGRLTVLIQLLHAASDRVDSSLKECLRHAWLEIKDRKGRMIDGVFVKEADLPQEQPSQAQVDMEANVHQAIANNL